MNDLFWFILSTRGSLTRRSTGIFVVTFEANADDYGGKKRKNLLRWGIQRKSFSGSFEMANNKDNIAQPLDYIGYAGYAKSIILSAIDRPPDNRFQTLLTPFIEKTDLALSVNRYLFRMEDYYSYYYSFFSPFIRRALNNSSMWCISAMD